MRPPKWSTGGWIWPIRCRRRCSLATAPSTGFRRRFVNYNGSRQKAWLAAWPAAALILVAASLVGIRYGLTRRLDLGEPMARILQQSLGLETPETARNAPRKDFNFKGSSPEDGDSPLAQDRQPDEPDAQP